mgnify:CR=1 FL=1
MSGGRSAARKVLYMAALTAWDARSEDRNASGFAIVTDDAEGGMIDVHDRRPVVFSASDAATWMDPELSGEQAAELARVLKMPDVQARIKGLGGDVGAISVEQFSEMNRNEYERFGKLVRDANIKADGQ